MESQAALTPSNTVTILLPDDFTPALYWGALADLLGATLEQKDDARAKYALARFEQHIEMLKGFPFILSGGVLGGAFVQVDAVEVLDKWNPGWRAQAATPGAQTQPIVAVSGQNLVAYPSAIPVNLPLVMVANATVPKAAADFLQVSPDVLDVVLGYAQHTASFKMGGAEFEATLPLLWAIVQTAAARNSRVRAMSTFRDILYGRSQRENEIQPQLWEGDNA